MTVRRTHDEPSPGPSCFTITIEMSLHHESFIYFVLFACIVAPSSTNIDSLKVLSLMASKQDRIYACGRSKSVVLSARLIIGSNDKNDPEYMPLGTTTPSRATQESRATPKKVASGAVTASQSYEERTQTGMG